MKAISFAAIALAPARRKFAVGLLRSTTPRGECQKAKYQRLNILARPINYGSNPWHQLLDRKLAGASMLLCATPSSFGLSLTSDATQTRSWILQTDSGS